MIGFLGFPLLSPVEVFTPYCISLISGFIELDFYFEFAQVITGLIFLEQFEIFLDNLTCVDSVLTCIVVITLTQRFH